MNVTIFGTGYVGLVTGACFAEAGNEVVCLDVDQERIDRLNRGEVPIYEPGLHDLVERNLAAGSLRFTTDAALGVAHGFFLFVAVGTPPGDNGSADLRSVDAAAATIGLTLTEPKLVVMKSTVPVGTVDRVRGIVADRLRRRDLAVPFNVVSNPEFLKEGAALDDFMRPSRIVVGADDPRSIAPMRELYAPFNRNHEKLLVMDARSAEFTKYAANAMLATKISLMNELANLADRLGVDIGHVRAGIGSDPRIGYGYIYPGCGYGGSCFPKDVRALAHTAAEVGYDAELLRAVEAVNQRQKQVLFEKIRHHFGGALAGRTFALWGLAFKPETDDMREAPSRPLMEALWDAGATVRAFDPKAMGEARRIYGERADLVLCAGKEDALDGADALVIATEWRAFRSLNFAAIRSALKQPLIFDGRNLFDPERMGREGFTYYGVGLEARPTPRGVGQPLTLLGHRPDETPLPLTG